MTRYLIDSDLAIYSMGGERDSRLNMRLASCYPGDVSISAISFAEVALGTWNGKPPRLGHPLAVGQLERIAARRELRPQRVHRHAALIEHLTPDAAAARTYAQLPFKRARFGCLLAAHALSIGAIVLTNNEVDFADVPGLKVENWMV